MEQTKIYNYSDIIYSCLVPHEIISEFKMSAHVLIYVYSGEMCIDDQGREIKVQAGEYIFIKRDNKVKMLKRSFNNISYKAISIRFERNFLRSYFNKVDKTKIPAGVKRFKDAAINLPKTPYFDSLFMSLFPYTDSNIKPADELIDMKMQEAMFCLLNNNPNFYPTLFDFNEPWKIDIMEFMEQNFMSDLPLEELASFTGRSLAAFKRDFTKISDLPPQKWIIQKRLETAYEMIIKQKKKVSEVFMDVGFKNRSHFTVAFKKQYGFSPGNAI